MTPRTERRRARRAVKAAAHAADRAIRIHIRRAFFDFETAGPLDRASFAGSDRAVMISQAGQTQVSPFAAFDLNIVHHPAFRVETTALSQGMFERKS